MFSIRQPDLPTYMANKYFVPVALSLCVASSAFASSVSFSSAVIDPSNTGSFLDNSGTLLEAVNFGTARTSPYTYNAPTTSSNPDPNVTFNGITFTPTAGAGNGQLTLNGSYYSITGVGTANNLGYDTGRFSNISQVNTSLYGLMYDVLRTGANNQRMQLTLDNLLVGQTYELQMIFSTLNLADNPAGNMTDRNLKVSAGTFTQGADVQNGSGADGNTSFLAYGPTTGARLVTANFTADSSTELFNILSGTTGGNSRVSLAGLVISQVPEPSTYALLMLGGAALAMFARRKKTA
jgi:hypothetical protein